MTLEKNDSTCPEHLLRRGEWRDVADILRFERAPGFHALVGTWPEQEHARALRDPDVEYWMVLDPGGGNAGFAILRGVQSPHRSMELKRFVIATPGGGLGQRALTALQAHVFVSHGAHRLWLHVFPTNQRALHVYRKAGFQQEGLLREAIYRDGQYHSVLLMAMLDWEYFNSPNR